MNETEKYQFVVRCNSHLQLSDHIHQNNRCILERIIPNNTTKAE